MAYINASSALTRVKLFIIKAEDATVTNNVITPIEADFYTAVNATTGAVTLTTANGPLLVPGLQDVTINNANGSFRWKQLDEGGEKVITTNATNSLSGNFVLDPVTFFGTGAGGLADDDGIFQLSNERTEVAFLIAPEGVIDKTVLMGTGFIGALAPTVSADSPVWVSPITIEVNGDYTKYTSTLAA
jgi:hypothetical protein